MLITSRYISPENIASKPLISDRTTATTLDYSRVDDTIRFLVLPSSTGPWLAGIYFIF